MTQYLTRRELREAERAGKLSAPEPEAVSDTSAEVSEPTPAEIDSISAPEGVAIESAEAPAAQTLPPAGQFLSRRERRLAEASVLAPVEPVAAEETQVAEVYTESVTVIPDVIYAAIEQAESEPEPAPRLELEEPSADFTGSNLLAEPSTKSIVLDIAPEAIALPLDTGEIVSTGSISIIADPTTGSLTGGLDGLNVDDADRVDAVTGVITLVEPVSALDLINQRVSVGVVPDEVLRKGWWLPWAYGALGLGLAVATIIATITIISALGD